MAKILLSAFEPFDGERTNPSIDVVAALTPDLPGEVRALTLPVSFERAPKALLAELDSWRPDVVVSVGLARARQRVSFERIAVNLADARIPDNDGDQPAGVELIPNGPVGLWSLLPVVEAARGRDFTELSMTAGLYVCNAVFYHEVAWAMERGAKAGFVHVPPCDGPNEVAKCAAEIHWLITMAVNDR